MNTAENLETPSFNREATVNITKENAPYAPEEQLGEYKLKRWSWYEKQGVVGRASQIIDVERGIVVMQLPDYYAEMLFVIVRVYPEALKADEEEKEKKKQLWSIDYIKTELDPDVGDLLRDAGRDLNGLTEKEKKIFLQLSEQSKDTLT